MLPHVEPADQGRVGREGLLDLLQGRGLAGVGLILPVQRVLELDPLAAEGTLLVAQHVDLLVLLLGVFGLGGQAGDPLIEPLELAGQARPRGGAGRGSGAGADRAERSSSRPRARSVSQRTQASRGWPWRARAMARAGKGEPNRGQGALQSRGSPAHRGCARRSRRRPSSSPRPRRASPGIQVGREVVVARAVSGWPSPSALS